VIAAIAAGTSLAEAVPVRSLLTVGLVLGSCVLGARTVDAEPLWDAELRVGMGVDMGGGQGMASARRSPLTVAAVGAVAISYEPPLSGYAGLVVETLDRSAVGGTAGIRFTPALRRFRLAAGGTALVAPYTLYGGTASAGACFSLGSSMRACADAQLTAYFAGDDLAPGKTVTQAQLVLAVAFDGH
jgi:hypothetical protein